MKNPRYDGRPLLRFLELYLLHAIGELGEADDAKQVEMTPHLQATFDHGGNWVEIMESVLDLPDNFPETVRGYWHRNLEIDDAASVELTPQAFVEMFADDNFPMEPNRR